MRDQAGPLPAQPYILVLWATHIGRYAIKHSPSENARASEPSRAIVKVLGTLCERSPLPPYPAADCTGTALLAALLSSPFSHTLSLSRRRLSSSLSSSLFSLYSSPLVLLHAVLHCGRAEPRPGSLTPQTPNRSQTYAATSGETKRNERAVQPRKQRRSLPSK